MVLFFVRGEVDSDKYIKYCYSHYYNLMVNSDIPKEIEIIREENKKPRFNTDKVYFNLSHSHGVTVLGISFSEIGVDIEKFREIDYKKFNFIDAEDEEDFFIQWTERESYLKYTGVGLKDIKKAVPEDAHFEHFPVFDEYHACVCAEEQNIRAFEMDINAIE